MKTRPRLLAFGWALLFAGLLCLGQQPHAQLSMTGAGLGAPAGGGGGGGNVTVDVVGTEKYQATSNSFNYTGLTITGGLTNPGLVCVLNRAHASNDVTAGLAMTWNGVSMALRKNQSGSLTSNGVALFGLHNPASGAQTLAVSATNIATDNFVNCASFSNVNQTSDALAFPNPIGSSGGGATIAVTSASGHIAVGTYINGVLVSGTLGTPIFIDNANGAISNSGADYVSSSGASTTVGSAATSNAIAGMDISN